DSEIILQIVRAQSSRVPTPLPDDPYVAVRQAHLVNTDTEFGPVEDPRETQVPHPLLVVPSPIPSSDDLHLTIGRAHTPATIDTESEPEEAPSKTEEFEAFEPSNTRITSSHSSASSDSSAPLAPDHPLTQTSPTPAPTQVLFHRRTACMAVRTQPTLSLGMSARIAKAAALSPSSFCKRYRSSYETPLPSSSLTLPIRKRYRGTSELLEDTEDKSLYLDTKREGSEDEGYGSKEEGPSSEEEEEAAPEGQQQAVSAKDTVVDEPLGLGYGALRCHELVVGEGEMPNTFEIPEDGMVYTDILTYVPPVAPVQTPPSPEWSSGSLPVSPSSPVVPTPVASLVTTPVATIAIDEDEFLEVGAQLELHGSILHDHIQLLDALPPTLFEGYDRDLKELYTSSGAVRDEIFSQRYRFRSLEREQERATMTFNAIWRLILALEAWAGQTDTQRAALWYAIYDTQRENHDLRMQIAEERRERLELTNHVARMERRQESKGE
ncbi:hypothetical protein Tco_0661791, partial [Tanacetum coccineum]